MACFIAYYEGFLWIEPHFSLWKALFFIKPHRSQKNPSPVGGAGFQRRTSGMCSAYIKVIAITSNMGWHKEWFYCSNPAPSLPAFDSWAPLWDDIWGAQLTPEESATVAALEKCIPALHRRGVTGDGVLASFFECWIQPAKLRAHTLCMYTGSEDLTREA